MTDDIDVSPQDGGEPAEAAQAAPEAAEAGAALAEANRKLAYLAAEFDNYRKREQREREAHIAFGNERLVQAMLHVHDNLERAIAQGAASGSAEGLLEGVRMTYALFLAELRKFGVEQLGAAGMPFDPAFHEAVAQLPSDAVPEGRVIEEACKGYTLNGRLLRAAQVAVSSGGAGGNGDGGR